MSGRSDWDDRGVLMPVCGPLELPYMSAVWNDMYLLPGGDLRADRGQYQSPVEVQVQQPFRNSPLQPQLNAEKKERKTTRNQDIQDREGEEKRIIGENREMGAQRETARIGPKRKSKGSFSGG